MSDRTARIEAALAERLARPSGIPKAPPGSTPLSPVQQSLWVRSQVLPDEPENARPVHVRLQGGLVIDALNRALTALVERHEVLRTTYPLDDEEPVQVVGEAPVFEVPVVDLSASGDPEFEAHEACTAHGAIRFDLTSEVPFRPRLFRLAPDDHVLSIAMSHIVFDGWSEQRFLNDLAALYDAAVSGLPHRLPELTHQVRDHAAWVRSRTSPEREEADLAWWSEKLIDCPPDLELPTDRPPFDETADPVVQLDLGRPATDSLSTFAAAQDSTLFMVMMAGLQVLVMRLTGQTDVLIGFPSAGRARPELEPLIGCFIDTAVLRTQVDPDRSFAEALKVTRHDLLEALEHQVPYSRVLAAVRPWTGEARVPLSRVYAQFRNFPGDIRSSDHLEISLFGPPVLGSAHLSVSGDLVDGSMRLRVRYDRTRFARQTIERHVASLVRLMTMAAGNDDTPIGDLSIIGDEDRELLTGGWDGASMDAVPPLVADAVREAAARYPDHIALQWGDESLTYAELDARVDRMAAALQARGLEAEDAVVLFIERGPTGATAVLAALRAGVAFVPVDRSLTAEWLATVVEQVVPALIVSSDGRVPLSEPPHPVVTVDQLIAEGNGELTRRPGRSDLAYVLYTSGSTGAPKGVMVEQGHLASYVAAHCMTERTAAGERIMWFHSMSFDAVFKTMFVALTTGVTLIQRNDEALTSIQRLFAWYEQEGITRYWGPTSFVRVIMEEAVLLDLALPPSLRVLSFGGEQLRADVLDPFLAKYGDRVAVINNYGPTEASVSVTYSYLDTLDPPVEWVPIGRPLAACKVRVVDTRGALCPIGVYGELLLGGPQVARGYLDEPGLTADRFFTDDEGERWYRSGDRGRWLPNGNLEVVGRTDRQVKVRGFRVEPVEIEAALVELDGVRDAATVVGIAADGDSIIHAYAETGLSVEALRAHLQAHLPAFLVPATVTPVDRFPRTTGDKLDVKRLPPPGSTAGGPGEPDEAMHAGSDSPVEAVREIWKEVLAVDQIELTDGFFALGGHSLLAIRLLSRINARLGVTVPLDAVFTMPTFGEFAALVDGLTAEATAPKPATPTVAPVVATREPEPPRPPVDAVAEVRSIWREVLGVGEVGDEDGFFALGGHSLLAIRLLSRITQRVGVSVPLETVFATPNFRDFAEVVDRLARGAVTFEPTPRQLAEPPIPAASLDELLAEIEELSDEDAARLLAELEDGS